MCADLIARCAPGSESVLHESAPLPHTLLGRLETEALDPLIKRLFSIMKRKGLITPPPEEFGEVELEVQYVSILSDARINGNIEASSLAVGGSLTR